MSAAVYAHGHDLTVLFVLLALIAFGGSIWLAFRNMIAAAVALAFIGVVIVVLVL